MSELNPKSKMQSTQEIQEIQEIQESDRIVEICATCIKYITFKIPEELNLLSEEECEECDFKNPFSWWIRRKKLYYIDADGKTKILNGEEYTNAYPDNVETRYAEDI